MTTYGITGATGHLGRLAVELLLERGVAPDRVVALARTPDRAAGLAARGVQVRAADYDAPDTLAPALAGVDVLLLVSATEVGRRLPQHSAVIEAARAAGVTRIAYTSVLRADRSRLGLAPEHAATEQLLRDSGLEHVLLRNSWYVENYTDQLGHYLATGAIVAAAGGGSVSAATREDYARAAVAVLLEDGHAGRTYELGGTPFTLADLAAVVSEVSGTPVVYRPVGSAEQLEGLRAAGLPDSVAELLVDFDEAAARGELHTDSGDLEQLIGRPSTPLPDAVADALRAQQSAA